MMELVWEGFETGCRGNLVHRKFVCHLILSFEDDQYLKVSLEANCLGEVHCFIQVFVSLNYINIKLC